MGAVGELAARGARHDDVGEHQGEALARLEHLDRLLAVLAGDHLEAGALEHAGRDPPHVVVVLGEENAGARRDRDLARGLLDARLGRRRPARAPRPGSGGGRPSPGRAPSRP